ncbi:MAG: hypothetical protein V3R23_07600, partial [Nitrospinaceae bacterium]
MPIPTTPEKIATFIISILFIGFQLATPAYSFENVSLKNYHTQAIKINNPVDLTRLQLNKTFQV